MDQVCEPDQQPDRLGIDQARDVHRCYKNYQRLAMVLEVSWNNDSSIMLAAKRFKVAREELEQALAALDGGGADG
jgi:hypothetical protein